MQKEYQLLENYLLGIAYQRNWFPPTNYPLNPFYIEKGLVPNPGNFLLTFPNSGFSPFLPTSEFLGIGRFGIGVWEAVSVCHPGMSLEELDKKFLEFLVSVIGIKKSVQIRFYNCREPYLFNFLLETDQNIPRIIEARKHLKETAWIIDPIKQEIRKFDSFTPIVLQKF